MADISDVRNALVSLIESALYPNGTHGAGAIANGVAIIPGYPAAEDLQSLGSTTDDGILNAIIAVYDLPGPRDTTRYFTSTYEGTLPTATLGWTVSVSTATLTGTVSVPQNLCISDTGTDYVYAVKPTDTLSTIATALGAMIPGATVSGASITTPDLKAARVGVVDPTGLEVSRQESRVTVSVYAVNDVIRSAIVLAIKPTLDRTDFLLLADGSSAWLRPGQETSYWQTTKLSFAQSNLGYRVEYPTVLLGSAAQMIAWVLTVTPNNGPTTFRYEG